MVSVDLTAPAFDALRGAPDLRMTCCDARAVPKRSVRGLPFFAHAARGPCTSSGESELHLHAKADVLQAARAAGWMADVEVPGQAPDGLAWRADVLCTRGRHRVAFEVQRSGITLHTLHERQALYQASGVRAFWLMRTHEKTLRRAQPWQRATPAVYLDEQRRVPALDLDLSTFTRAALGGHLVLFPAPQEEVRVRVITEPKRCFRCHQDVGLVRMVAVIRADASHVRVLTPGTHPEVGGWLTDLFGTGAPPFVSWPAGAPHSFHCPRCGALRVTDRFQASWVDAAEPALWARRQTNVWDRPVALSPDQHAWLVQASGQVWTVRPRTTAPRTEETPRGEHA